MKSNIRNLITITSIFFIALTHSIKSATWQGATTSDVTDEALTITDAGGTVQLPSGVRFIYAQTQDIIVTIVGTPVVQANATGSQLILKTNPGFRIIFNLVSGNQLSFVGSADAGLTPLLMLAGPDNAATGSGSVIFNCEGNSTVAFTSLPGTGGTQFYAFMTVNNPVQIEFMRDTNAGQNDPIIVNVGEQSLISYLSPNIANTSAIFDFDPTNSGTGRLNLNIEDTGAVIVTSNLSAQTVMQNVTLADIDRSQTAGGITEFNITSGSGSAGLLVTNANNTLSNLRVNPYRLSPNPFNGILYGFVVGVNGQINIDGTYLDYVGLSLNQCPSIDGTVSDCDDIDPTKLVKSRNPSALIIDGGDAPALPAVINLGACSAAVFRSGVNNNGIVENDIFSAQPFTITPALRTPGEGNIVFDVEGACNVVSPSGSQGLDSKLEILSWYVEPTGGQVLIENTTCPTTFPLRTFAKISDCIYVQYNSACFMVNNALNLFDTSINHTDQNHFVYRQNSVSSEPAYIGGETHTIDDTVSRPYIAFNNSRLYVHTNIALTGVDLLTPNTVDLTDACIANVSYFTFYQNGTSCDKGTGRAMVLGTQIGSTACNGCSVISNDAHFDVMQLTDCGTANSQTAILNTAPNDNTIVDPDPTCGCVISPDAANQPSIQSIHLGNASNITVGNYNGTFTNITNPTLMIAGNYFSFTTNGGSKCLPAASNITGQGGIFVDENGNICICPQYRVAIDAMVTKSGDGQVNLPENQVFFGNLVGISAWQPDLTTQPVLVTADQHLSDYTINWLALNKNYTVFTPYPLNSVNACDCPPVTTANISGIPVIQGEVNQLQIQGSRIGDTATIAIDGGFVRELIFEQLGYAAEASAAILVMQNDGRVGLGTEHRDPDSYLANIVLGANGVQLIANGNAQIEVNEDLIINNVCALLKGPDFVAGNVLQFTSDTQKAIRITQTGALDLSQFSTGDIVEFNGDLVLILEPGARIIFGENQPTLRLADSASIYVEPLAGYQQTSTAAGVASTDPFRARLVGVGDIQITNQSQIAVPINAFLGIETVDDVVPEPCGDTVLCNYTGPTNCTIPTTNIRIMIFESGRLLVGDENSAGGAIQVGNTVDRAGHSITFRITHSGRDAVTEIKEQGFLGFGVGIVDKKSIQPNNWLVGSLFNVTSNTLEFIDGLFEHNRIYSGDDAGGRASLFAIATQGTYSLLFDDTSQSVLDQRLRYSEIHGGANIVRLIGTVASVNPVVTGQVGVSGSIERGILASAYLQDLVSLTNVSATTFFNAIKTLDINGSGSLRCKGLGNYAKGFASFRNARVQDRVSYVDGTAIGRQDISDIIDVNLGSPEERRQRARDVGAVQLTLVKSGTPPRPVATATQIQ